MPAGSTNVAFVQQHQRQPTRINCHLKQETSSKDKDQFTNSNSSLKLADTAGHNGNGNHKKSSTNNANGSNNSNQAASRLKSSTISKVPSARSRLKQPVASLSTTTQAGQLVTSNRSLHDSQRKSNHNLLATKTLTGSSSNVKATETGVIRARPTSLALAKSPPRRLSDTPRLYTSILPKLTANRPSAEVSDKHNFISNRKHSAHASKQQNHLAGESKQCSNAGASDGQRVQSQQADKRKYATKQTASTTSDLESCLSGLKNLVAIVRPQHTPSTSATTTTVSSSTSPANSSASARATIARTTISIGYSKPNNCTTTATTTRFSGVKNESRKVNLTHKDVNGCIGLGERKKTGGKQDEKEITIPGTTDDKAGRSRSGASTCESGGSSTSDYYSSPSDRLLRSSLSSSAPRRQPLSTNGSGHFAHSANGATITSGGEQSPVGLGGNNHVCDKPRLQHEKIKQQKYNNNKYQDQQLLTSRKCPPDGQSSSSVGGSLSNDALRPNLNQETTNDCFSDDHDKIDHDDDDESDCVAGRADRFEVGLRQLNAANATAIHLKKPATARNKVCCDQIKTKPMGQQVLSLMMLDVGLAPAADSTNEQLEVDRNRQSHHQENSSHPSSSHVRVQSYNQSADSDADQCFIENNSSCFRHDGNKAAAAAEMLENWPLTVRTNLDDLSGGNALAIHQHNHHLVPSRPTHELLSLQVRFANDRYSDSFKSASLPCSPRMSRSQGVRNNLKHAAKNSNANQSVATDLTADKYREFAANTSFRNRGNPRMAAEAPAIGCDRNGSMIQRQQLEFSASPNSVCDDQANSMDSSLCSSLNYCPPLLTLSNQLNGLTVDQLLDRHPLAGQTTQKEDAEVGENDNAGTREISPGFQCPAKREHLKAQSPDQVARVAKQHRLLTNNSDGSSIVCGDSARTKIDVQISRKIDHVDACSAFATAITRPGAESVGKVDSASHKAKSSCQEEQPVNRKENETVSEISQVRSNRLYTDIDQHFPDARLRTQMHQNMDQMARRQPQQQRSNSISGQDFSLNGSYQRLKYSICPPGDHAFADDTHMQNEQTSGRNNLNPPPFQHNRSHIGRSPSPISICGGQLNGQQNHPNSSFKYPHHQRNQLHASLECLSGPYSDYQQMKSHQMQQQQQQQQQMQANQHYAASYVLASPPANTVFNQTSDQDFAAAVMGGPSQYQSLGHAMQRGSNYNVSTSQSQNLVNRALSQISHSPFRRMTSSNINTNSCSQNPLGPTPANPYSMRVGHSSLSLASSSSILEDKLQIEIRKLQNELKNEKEKNEALNSQLNINSSLMAAFEQSLTTLNSRLRKLTTLTEKKDNEIAELKQELFSLSQASLQQNNDVTNDTRTSDNDQSATTPIKGENPNASEQELLGEIEQLKRQLLEKDRLLTDTRLEALSAAHQLEQLESKLNGEHSLVMHEEELDEGVVNHSPSESEATTDSAHFSEMNNQIIKSQLSSNNEANIGGSDIRCTKSDN